MGQVANSLINEVSSFYGNSCTHSVYTCRVMSLKLLASKLDILVVYNELLQAYNVIFSSDARSLRDIIVNCYKCTIYLVQMQVITLHVY